ncbi:phage head-tail connector protein [Bradyrhizobium sp. HKCCYLR1023]|uniref:phage head-tail connector protein n=1 Tax=Bradyrhizobium TaxID=374 RepID=UPI003EB83BC1
MRSVVEVLTAAGSERLTTLDRVKGELNITSSASDVILTSKIDEASSDVAAAIGKRLPSEGVRETFWHDEPVHPHAGYRRMMPSETTLFLSRAPVTTIASVTVDDVPLDAADYRLDPEAGLLDRLSSGYPCAWRFCKSVVINYTGGFVLPGNNGRTLPFGIEGAVVALVSSYWASKGRDPTLRAEDIPGVMRREYWVGAVGDPELLPPRVLASLSQFRRPVIAVA